MGRMSLYRALGRPRVLSIVQEEDDIWRADPPG